MLEGVSSLQQTYKMVSARGIHYTPDASPYETILMIDGVEFVFTFSSEFYMNRFERELDSGYTENMESYLRVKYGQFDFYLKSLAPLILYKNIEKRFFCVSIGGKEERCQDNIKFVGTIEHRGKRNE